MRGEEREKGRGDEIYSDYMWMLSIMPCGSVTPVTKHFITQCRQQCQTLYLPFSLCHFTSLLNSSICPFLLLPCSFSPILSLLLHPLSQLPIPLCFYCHLSLFESNHALFFFFIYTYPPLPSSHQVSSPTLFLSSPLHLRHGCEAAAITMFFEVSY